MTLGWRTASLLDAGSWSWNKVRKHRSCVGIMVVSARVRGVWSTCKLTLWWMVVGADWGVWRELAPQPPEATKTFAVLAGLRTSFQPD